MESKWDSVYYNVEMANIPCIDYYTYYMALREEVHDKIKTRTYRALVAVTKTVIYHG